VYRLRGTRADLTGQRAASLRASAVLPHASTSIAAAITVHVEATSFDRRANVCQLVQKVAVVCRLETW
jgi:hypothetical protein